MYNAVWNLCITEPKKKGVKQTRLAETFSEAWMSSMLTDVWFAGFTLKYSVTVWLLRRLGGLKRCHVTNTKIKTVFMHGNGFNSWTNGWPRCVQEYVDIVSKTTHIQFVLSGHLWMKASSSGDEWSDNGGVSWSSVRHHVFIVKH